jgi:hypothetical protein
LPDNKKVNTTCVIARLKLSALMEIIHRSNLTNVVHWKDLPLTKRYLIVLLGRVKCKLFYLPQSLMSRNDVIADIFCQNTLTFVNTNFNLPQTQS